MTWNYSGDPAASALDELRFVVQDTMPDRPLLTDEECNYLLANWMDRYSSVIYVASVAAAQISRKFAGVVSVSSDGVTVNVEKISDRYAEMAVTLRSEYAASMVGGEVDLTSIMFDAELDDQIKPLVFGLGMHDNPEAGEQDFAGKSIPPRFEFPS